MQDPRHAMGRVLAGLAALVYIATAWLHSTGFDAVTRLAREGPSDLAALMPALWLVFSLDLVVVGLVIAVVTWRPSGAGRLVVAIAALCPLGAAGLQLRFLGFIPPTAVLLADGALALVAAVTMRGSQGSLPQHSVPVPSSTT